MFLFSTWRNLSGCNLDRQRSQLIPMAKGSWKEKRGILIAFLGPDDDATDFLPAELPKSRLKGQRTSLNRRSLVEVPRSGRSTLSDYYAPRLADMNVNANLII
ncbi:hypothetical protein, partial [Brevibacillus borstelensis]|uniref:hypothetical protein n=1 Tax=Brevibacillus borstelensis TaxID=45462 RepID=UPI001FAA1E17